MGFTRLSGVVLAGSLLAGGAWAQQADVAPTKIAFVWVQKALVNTDEGKARAKELDDWVRPRQEELARLNKEVNDIKGEILSKQGVASDDVIAQLNRRGVAKQRELEDRQRDLKREAEEKQQAVLKDLGAKLQDVITKYSEASHYTVVFIANPDQLAYLAPSADITDTVIKLYNERYPLAAKAPAAPAK
jgi:outer membrane protein